MASSDKKRFAAVALCATAIFLLMIHTLVTLNDGKYSVAIDIQRNFHCLPWTVFWVEKSPSEWKPARGDLVQYEARRMGHGFDQMRVVKLIVGVEGDRIDVRSGRVFVNGTYMGGLNLLRELKKSMADYERTTIVPPGRYFVMGSQPFSYDSRYWGLITNEEILGRASPLF